MVVIALANRWAARSARAMATLGRRLAAGSKRLVRIIKNRGEVRRLRELDERSLADIGLNRAEIEGALAGGLWDDPSRLLAARDVERRQIVLGHARSEARRLPLNGYGETPAAC